MARTLNPALVTPLKLAVFILLFVVVLGEAVALYAQNKRLSALENAQNVQVVPTVVVEPTASPSATTAPAKGVVKLSPTVKVATPTVSLKPVK